MFLAWPPLFHLLQNIEIFLGKPVIWAYIGYREIFKEGNQDAER